MAACCFPVKSSPGGIRPHGRIRIYEGGTVCHFKRASRNSDLHSSQFRIIGKYVELKFLPGLYASVGNGFYNRRGIVAGNDLYLHVSCYAPDLNTVPPLFYQNGNIVFPLLGRCIPYKVTSYRIY